MGTNSNNTLVNLFLYATLGTSAISVPIEFGSLQTYSDVKYSYSEQFGNWENSSLSTACTYNGVADDLENINTIVSFSRKLIAQSKDLENEYAEIVSRNFWDLI